MTASKHYPFGVRRPEAESHLKAVADTARQEFDEIPELRRTAEAVRLAGTPQSGLEDSVEEGWRPARRSLGYPGTSGHSTRHLWPLGTG